jgi:heme iron utilization protein
MSDNQRKSDAAQARDLIEAARTATLSVIDVEGAPYGALVNLGHDADAAPILLISELARHTKALRANPKASLAIAGPMPAEGDPLTGLRVTLAGEMHEIENSGVASRYVAEHPYSEVYVDFGDFSFWRMRVAKIYAIGGFGRIYAFEPGEVFAKVAS